MSPQNTELAPVGTKVHGMLVEETPQENGKALIFVLDDPVKECVQIGNALTSALDDPDTTEIVLVANVRSAGDEEWIKAHCSHVKVNAILNRRAKPAAVLEAQGRWLASLPVHEVIRCDDAGKLTKETLPTFTAMVAVEMQKKVSVSLPAEQGLAIVIPVHNCAPYLEQCLSSALAIKSDKTLVLIDDGSTDATHSIISDLSEKYSVVIDHITLCKSSGYAAVARNIGLTGIQAKRFGFIDADDWIEPKQYECALQEMEKAKADIATVCSFTRHDAITGEVEKKRLKYFTKPEYDLVTVLDSNFFSSIWNRIYSRKIILRSGIHFPRTHYSEDLCFSIWVHCYADKTIQSSIGFYHYRSNRPGSTTSERSGEEAFLHIEEFQKELDIYQNEPCLQNILRKILCKRMGSFRYTLEQLSPEFVESFKDILRESVSPLRHHFLANRAFTSRENRDFEILGIKNIIYS